MESGCVVKSGDRYVDGLESGMSGCSIATSISDMRSAAGMLQ